MSPPYVLFTIINVYLFENVINCNCYYLVAIPDSSSGVDEPWNEFILSGNLVHEGKT